MNNDTLTMGDLRQFTGSEQCYRHGLARKVLFTDGAKYLADKGGAYWLIDLIALAQHPSHPAAAEPFQLWTMRVTPNNTGTVTCEDGNGREVFRHVLDYTDFPLPEVQLYCTDNTILLPSEY